MRGAWGGGGGGLARQRGVCKQRCAWLVADMGMVSVGGQHRDRERAGAVNSDRAYMVAEIDSRRMATASLCK